VSAALDSTGGPAAIRGYLVQTIVALLDIAQAKPPFTEITLEPPKKEDQQFDFTWSDANGTFAVQVKSTINEFKKAAVEGWAKKLGADRSKKKCRLILVGNYDTALQGVDNIGAVVIEKKNLDLDGLLHEAAHLISVFMDDHKIDSCTAKERVTIAENLITKLLRYAVTRKRLTRKVFVGLLREWVKKVPRHRRVIDISRIIEYAPLEFLGRDNELKLLNEASAKVKGAKSPRPHILTFVALGGEGKTSLVAKWAAELGHREWPGWDAVFAWSFYRQGTREQTAGSSDLFLKEALTFFGDSELAGSAQRALEKGKRLAQLIGARRALLILDGLEPLQFGPTSPDPGKIKDKGLAALLGGLAASSQGLCVMTTRYSIPDLNFFRQTTAPEIALERLSKGAGVAVLRSLGVKGTPEQLEKLVEKVRGHALTLNLFGTFLRDRYAGNISEHDCVSFTDVSRDQGGHAFRVMDAYVRWFNSDGEMGKRSLAVLRLLGLFDRPATADCVEALLRQPVIPGLTELLVESSESQRNLTFSRLKAANLLAVNRNAAGQLISLDAHPLLREYFANKVRKRRKVWRAAHRRLYEHLVATTPEKDEPSLEDLQPLYQAVAHGCQAGLEEEAGMGVYYQRIMRGASKVMKGPSSDGFYSTRKLGAFSSDLGVLAFFFKRTWDRVSTSLSLTHQAKVFALVGFYLRAVGRLPQALATTTKARDIAVKQADWSNAARYASDLSELDLTMGRIEEAVKNAKQSVFYGDKIIEDTNRSQAREDEDGRKNWPMFTRAVHADALHKAGRRDEANARFREAEHMQAKREPEFNLLYCVQGSNYCDLLLAEPERAAWRVVLGEARDFQEPRNKIAAVHVESCIAVSRRAGTTLKWMTKKNWILDMALDHLSLARAGLYSAILQRSPLDTCCQFIEVAVEGLRNSGQQDDLPRGLLTRAWLRYLSGPGDGFHRAQHDLDEAWEIAARGPMPLFLADIRLHRARLFFREENYPWKEDQDGLPCDPRRDLAAAEAIIERCGYHRRNEELEDAKQAIYEVV
jgi:tetratricopeptide (TPR) repeat protein